MNIALKSSRAESAVSAFRHDLEARSGCEVHISPFDCGRYATDASHYQITPEAVAIPRHTDDLHAIVETARAYGMPITGRGGGTSQNGQPINRGVIVDCSKYLRRITALDPDAGRCSVEPGIVLDHLNAHLKPHGLWYPVDVSTASRATIGGMAGNNSCGARSIRYGTMRDNVESLRVMHADGGAAEWGALDEAARNSSPAALAKRDDLPGRLLHLGAANKSLIESRFPGLLRRVGGYNLDALIPDGAGGSGCKKGTPCNPAHLFIGSEGTLGLFERIDLKLAPLLPAGKVMGVCQFRSFFEAMQAAQHIVALGATAVELVDRTMIELGRKIPLFAPVVDRFVKGNPDALLIAEFAEDDHAENLRRLDLLDEMMADVMQHPDSVIRATEPGFQKDITAVRQQGLNIMMSMHGDAKPVSIVEDCAVPLKDLADYTRRLTEVFEKHGTSGTWYAHASVGCLHVRPVLNLKGEIGAKALRAVAEEAFALVREYKGSHSGEHGDGIARSEFHEKMFGREMVKLFAEVKTMLDPENMFNPGKIVNPPQHDDRSLFRYAPGYRSMTEDMATGFDWSAWGGLGGAVEMCNNNGACRKTDPGVMCPSYRITRNERDLVRGRANTLRLALSGQLGADAMTSPDMLDAMKLCVACKACKNECPTGVDMAKMKTEVLYRVSQKHGIGLRESLIAHMPRYAPHLARLRGLANLRDRIPGLAWLSEKTLGFASRRPLPVWAKAYKPPPPEKPDTKRAVILLGDTFNRSFEPHNLYAARRILETLGYGVFEPKAKTPRPLCCGRTYLAAGLVDHAKAEAQRMLETLAPFINDGIPVIGLEPSCLITLRDEFPALIPGAATESLAKSSFMLEEFLENEIAANRTAPEFRKPDAGCAKVMLHGHCHQKAARVLTPTGKLLGRIPGMEVETIESSCCGMAGAFGYRRETLAESIAMAELSLLPALRAQPGVPVIADGTSCRHQIGDLAGRKAEHAAVILAAHLKG